MKNKGITLIALVITIIIMLILVAVTVNYGIKSGLLTKAKQAKIGANVEQEKETLGNAVITSMMGSKAGQIDYSILLQEATKGGWKAVDNTNTTYSKDTLNYAFKVSGDGTITKVEKQVIPDELVEYLLGINHEGRTIMGANDAIVDTSYNFQKYDETPNFDETELGIKLDNTGDFVNFFMDEYHLENQTTLELILYITYKGNTYRVLTKDSSNMTVPMGTNSPIEMLEKVDKTSRVGKEILWDSNGDGIEEKWIVLYDDSINGLQIISADTMKYKGSTLILGSEEPAEALKSYNNAVTILNDACNEIIEEDEFIKDVRCVGSNPKNKSDETTKAYCSKHEEVGAKIINGKYSSTRLKQWYNGIYNEIAKPRDLNALEDYERMMELEILQSKNKQEYWFASRSVREVNTAVTFDIKYLDEDNGFLVPCFQEEEIYAVCDEDSNKPIESFAKGHELRPVVTLDTTKCILNYNSGDNCYTIVSK